MSFITSIITYITYILLRQAITTIGTSGGYPATVYIDQAVIHVDSLTNIYMDWFDTAVKGPMSLSFGDCNTGLHHQILGTTEISNQLPLPRKFVWAVLPTTMKKGCLFATHGSTGRLLARSRPYHILKKLKKRAYPELLDMHFDGVKHYVDSLTKSKKSFVADADAKQKKIGIIGAGISGLFSAYLLGQAGFENVEIVEASDRVGGRIHTAYFRNSTTIYHELGAMRIPISRTFGNETLPIRDQYTVLQLIAELNKVIDADNQIELIPWIQNTPNNLAYFNGYRMPDGRVPTKEEASAITKAGYPGDPPDIATEARSAFGTFLNDEWFKKMALDFYGAFKEYLEYGYIDWSESGWLQHKLHASLSAIDHRIGSEYYREVWHDMFDAFFLSKDVQFRTIQGGMSRFPYALRSILGEKITYNTKVTKIELKGREGNTGPISVQWKDKLFDSRYHSKEFDNVIVAVPFAVVRNWHLPRNLPHTLSRAIRNLEDMSYCKVIMEFQTRFWEQYEDRPIFGGCDDTDLPINYICYPSNNLGADGPGVMIASYALDNRLHFISMSDEEHVANVLDDVVEIHGEIARDQFTGNYRRKCWNQDPYAANSWALPLPEQRKLFAPSYFEYAYGLVFVGEHTDIQEGWMVSALNSAIRGVAMTLIDLGYVDEARKMVNHWNATWLNV